MTCTAPPPIIVTVHLPGGNRDVQIQHLRDNRPIARRIRICTRIQMGRNHRPASPFADARVRRAVAHAVNVPAILQDEVAYVPLYVQPLVWGAQSNIGLTQRPDNFLILNWVTVN